MSTLLIRGGTYCIPREPVTTALRGPDLANLSLLKEGYLLAENGIIRSMGELSDAPSRADHVIEATGRFVLPCWCDSHTHLVFARSREEEFVYRLQGMSYEEIAAKGGGILNSTDALRKMPEQELFEHASGRMREIISYGTGAVEIKSGYGLTKESEVKMLRVIRSLKEAFPIPVKATFLGAHAVPREYRNDRKGYLDSLLHDMIPMIAAEGLADYIDVFCDRGFYTPEEGDRILEAGTKYGLKPKIHVSQFENTGGVQLGIRHHAVSVDHLECAGAEEVRALSKAETIATLLPSCPFFLNHDYAPARALIDGGAAVALATDYNPGSTPSGNMPFVLSLACIKMQMLPEESINAATINGACAIEVQHEAGSLTPGRLANVIITREIPSLAYLPYAFGSRHIDQVVIRGNIEF